MDAAGRSDPEQLLAEARLGRGESLGKLLEVYRNYLGLLARTQIDLYVQGRVDSSDLVQETFLDACRDFGQFRGTSEMEWVAWLRKVLIYNLARVVQRQMVAQKRNARREVSLEQHLTALERSSGKIEAALVGPYSSPSAQAQRREHATLVADQLARLSADHREVIVLRNLEGLPFAEVARRMGRSAGAARVLWVRAVDQLRRLLEAEELV
ncbi:MAG TPA: sigma-70 family RNA polymerase sigma factor [Gemmataceae bacterium]|jgi:RNA polymerase sigma-70 factor (ECF subfamily)|nr:sigma-70 family RNA polymerase sigma factor [Gemmataceae bacterium]